VSLKSVHSFGVTTTLCLATLVGAAAAACSSSSSAPATSTPPAPDAGVSMPFSADPPTVYVAKVKDLLIGLPPTDDEIKQVEADPSQLSTLIAGWQQQPEYTTKMQRFFELAYQQTQITTADFADQAYPHQIDGNGSTEGLLLQNMQESFARTMIALTQQNQPLTLGVTTHQLMMTTALKETYAYLDAWEVDDNSKNTDYWKMANPNVSITIEASQGPIPISESVDPTSPNYMHWYDPDVGGVAANMVAGCNNDPIVLSGSQASGSALHYLLYGTITGWTGTGGVKCQQYGGSSNAPQLQPADFADWTMVTITQPAAGQAVTPFYDLPSLRSATQLVLKIPRTGFFSTPAFAANWQTNTSNTMRVTTNQALIVGLGSSIDGTDMTLPPSTPGLDTTHANQAACYTCHRLLDPTRSILAASWSWNYHLQLDTTYSSQPGLFAFRGVIKPVSSIDDFASAIATHPLFPAAWVQKLCYYANSSPCDASDPVFLGIVKDFQASNYNWNALVKELLSSPIVTNASETATAQQNGEVIAVARRDHLCAAINARLGFTDVCGLSAETSKTYANSAVPQIAGGLPSDAYGRGSTAPVLPNAPTLFFRAGTENICEALAAETIDVPTSKQTAGVTQWSSAQAGAAISDFVSVIMGLTPSDPRAAQAQAILTSHFQAAMKEPGTTSTAALQSTFVAACLAPSAVSIGM
jgi:hypothetical protein